MENVELKARDPDPALSLQRALAFGAVDHGPLRQRDTYFSARHGRLKLREIEGRPSELIAYARPDTREPELSDYALVPVPDAAALQTALQAALGVTVVVSKRRRLLIWEGVRIHLDEVDGLGSFIEFEGVIGPAGDRTAATNRIERLRAELKIEDANLVAVGYSDLLLIALVDRP